MLAHPLVNLMGCEFTRILSLSLNRLLKIEQNFAVSPATFKVIVGNYFEQSNLCIAIILVRDLVSIVMR